MSRNREGTSRSKHETRQHLARSLGDTAREARKREGLTQADVAERIGVATEVYGRLERGLLMPSVPTLRRLCVALRLAADSLLALGPAEPPAWARTEPSPEQEPPQLRRLLRHLRKLNPEQLRALSNVAATLRRQE
ncbi:helix-turn-helix domain-containing protein [Cystobacter fuscus]|uniref:helix-turn-helix domain-containing protein n=1 Tax=Cystobacter fuscus TaxID=43 RepID=UPI001E610043|nr:helix-turn-helix transcriptional regulator [Cystobacter fuscus]